MAQHLHTITCEYIHNIIVGFWIVWSLKCESNEYPNSLKIPFPYYNAVFMPEIFTIIPENFQICSQVQNIQELPHYSV